MAGPFRCTMFFRDRSYGWSETHWAQSGVPDLTTVANNAVDLVKVRAALLAGTADADPQINYVRVSDDSVRGDSFIFNPQAAGNNVGGNKLAVPGMSAVPYSVILLRGESGSLNHKNIYLSGVPADFITDPAGPVLNATYQKAFNFYRARLISDWAWAGKTKGGANPPKPISLIGGLANNVITCPAHGFATGDKVFISKADPKYPVTGYHQITVIDANSFSLNGVAVPGYVYIGGGVATKFVAGLFPYTNVLIRGQTHRNRGRPFPFVRGRQKRKH